MTALERNRRKIRESKDLSEFFTPAPTFPKADRMMTLDETTGLLKAIATAMVAKHGFYTFTDSASGEKVLVLA